jgi:hypothetical protein
MRRIVRLLMALAIMVPVVAAAPTAAAAAEPAPEEPISILAGSSRCVLHTYRSWGVQACAERRESGRDQQAVGIMTNAIGCCPSTIRMRIEGVALYEYNSITGEPMRVLHNGTDVVGPIRVESRTGFIFCGIIGVRRFFARMQYSIRWPDGALTSSTRVDTPSESVRC